MNILFVCRYNRFRSVLAEAFFKKYNKNKSLNVRSAAPTRGRPIGDNVKTLAKEYGLKIKNHPEGMTSETMIWQNLTVIAADNVPESLFDKNKELGKKVIKWNIKDVDGDGIDEMKQTAEKIKGKIIQLIKELEAEH